MFSKRVNIYPKHIGKDRTRRFPEDSFQDVFVPKWKASKQALEIDSSRPPLSVAQTHLSQLHSMELTQMSRQFKQTIISNPAHSTGLDIMFELYIELYLFELYLILVL